MTTEKVWWTSSTGRIELQMTLEQAESVSHSGDCEMDVNALIPKLKKQLDKIKPDILARELREYGAWTDAELANHAANVQRLVWIAGCDLREAV